MARTPTLTFDRGTLILHPPPNDPVLRLEFGGDAPVAVARMKLSEFMQTFDQFTVLLRALKPVLLRAPGLTECSTNPPFTNAQLTLDMVYGVTACIGR